MNNNIQTPVNYPIKIEAQYPEKSSRFLAFLGITMLLKFIILIPHLIALWVLGIIGCFASWFAFWAVLFTGKYPRSLFNFIAGFLKWQVKVNAWFYSLTDKYPPFSLH